MNKLTKLPTPQSILYKAEHMSLKEPLSKKDIKDIDSMLLIAQRGMDENPDHWSDVYDAVMEKYDEAKVMLGITKSLENIHKEEYAA